MLAKWAVRLIVAVMMLGCCTVGWGQSGAQKLFFEGYELLKDGKAKDAIPKFEAGLRPNRPTRWHATTSVKRCSRSDSATRRRSSSASPSTSTPTARSRRTRANASANLPEMPLLAETTAAAMGAAIFPQPGP